MLSLCKTKPASLMLPCGSRLDARGAHNSIMESGIARRSQCGVFSHKTQTSMCKTRLVASGICLIICAVVLLVAVGWAVGLLREKDASSGSRGHPKMLAEPLTNADIPHSISETLENNLFENEEKQITAKNASRNENERLLEKSEGIYLKTNVPKRLPEKLSIIKKIHESSGAKGVQNKVESSSLRNRTQDALWRDTQISSPDDQVTTHLSRLSAGPDPTTLLRHDVHGQIRKKDSAASSKNSDITAAPPVIHQPVPIIAEDMSVYGPDDYFYNEDDAHAYYYDYETNTWTDYFLEKIQELYDWVTNDFGGQGEPSSKGSHKGFVPQILKALNHSLIEGDSGIFLEKLKNIYYSENNVSSDFDPEKSRKLLANTSSVVSFGLLALDVMLLRNIQLMAWDDQETANNELIKDPEIFALNALFMDPKKVKKIYEELETHKSVARSDSEHIWTTSLQDPQSKVYDPTSLTSGFYTNVDFSTDIVDFAISTTRAAAHLGRAFRLARLKKSNGTVGYLVQMLASEKTSGRGDFPIQLEGPAELDCVWTLYCRNLNKATRMAGPYGFLARLNSLGLRMVIGDLPMDKVIEVFLEESLKGSKGLRCDKLFPKCSGQNAAKIVLEGIIGRPAIQIKQNHRLGNRNISP